MFSVEGFLELNDIIIETGSSFPSSNLPSGSLYIRDNGILYIRKGSTWEEVSGSTSTSTSFNQFNGFITLNQNSSISILVPVHINQGGFGFNVSGSIVFSSDSSLELNSGTNLVIS